MHNQIIPCPICPGFVTVADDYVCDQCGPAPRVPYWNLKETRKKDREIMLLAMRRLCDKFGIVYNIHHQWLGRKRASAIEIEGSTGLSVTIDFDGDSCQPDVFVVSWHMALRRPPNTIIRGDFAGDRNPYHKLKATDVFRGFEQLIRHMSIRLQRIAEGTATKTKESAPAETSGTK